MALFCNSLCEKSATLTSLGLFLDSELLGRCLDVLASNPKCAIQELSVFPTGPSFSLTVIENLKLFLDNNNSLRRIRFEDSNTFLEISECIMGAVNLTEVVFNKCSFEDDASVRALKRVLQKPGLTSFRLVGWEGKSNVTFTPEEMASIIQQPALRSVQIMPFYYGNDCLSALLKSAETSQLKVSRLDIWRTRNKEES